MFCVVCWQSSFFLRNTVELFAQVRAFANASCYERLGLITTFSCEFMGNNGSFRERNRLQVTKYGTQYYTSVFLSCEPLEKLTFCRNQQLEKLTDTFLNVAYQLLNGRNRN